MAGGNSNKKKNPKKISTSKAPSTSESPISGTKAPTSSKGKKPATNDVSPLPKATPQGRPPLPPSSSSSSVPYAREQDCLMPVANVTRVMRRILPSHAKISEEAKDTVLECVSEFISFITAEANEKCHKEKRKTVTAVDLISAMSTLGFDDYVGPLSTYLRRYREAEAVERGRVTQLPMRRQTVASLAIMVRPSMVVGHDPTTTAVVATASATATDTVTATGSYIGNDGDHGFGLINNACYYQFDVGSSLSNDGNLLQFGDHFDQLIPMVAPCPNASNNGVYQDQDETYDPFAQFKRLSILARSKNYDK